MTLDPEPLEGNCRSACLDGMNNDTRFCVIGFRPGLEPSASRTQGNCLYLRTQVGRGTLTNTVTIYCTGYMFAGLLINPLFVNGISLAADINV